MIVAGIDPGLSGAIAFLDLDTGAVEVVDMPVLAIKRGGKAKRDIDPHALAALFWQRHAGHAIIESVGAMPGQGTVSTFAFGKSYGVVIGVLAAVGIPYTLGAPNKWKRAIGVGEGKDASRARASQLLPQAADQWLLVKHHGRAEAAMLALYGERLLAGSGLDAT